MYKLTAIWDFDTLHKIEKNYVSFSEYTILIFLKPEGDTSKIFEESKIIL